MLIKFSVENWMSFRDSTTIWMATDESEYLNDRIPSIPKYDWKVLPVASIFGGNASGKSNLIEAIDFARWLISEGPKEQDSPMAVRPFKLDTFSKNSPTKMNFVVLVDEVVYDYSFSLTHNSVVSERLVKVNSKSENLLFERKSQKIKFFNSLKNKDYISNFSKSVRPNQLFLSLIGRMDPINSWPVYSWFRNSLVIIHPETKPTAFMFGDTCFQERVNNVLSKLDCGVHSIVIEDVTKSVEKTIPVSLKRSLERGDRVSITAPRIELSAQEGEILARELATHHQMIDGQFVPFTIDEESDGTERVLDLIPGFIDISSKGSKKVYIVDEIDRSLHTFMSRRLLESFLDNCTPESRSQLLFSTHDIFLLDKFMLRRDEMFLTQRMRDGSTTICSIDDFENIETDYELYKDYFSGRFGGIPDIMLGGYDLRQEGEDSD